MPAEFAPGCPATELGLPKRYLEWGSRSRSWVSSCACCWGSTGRCFTRVLAGCPPRCHSPLQGCEGRSGRGQKPPPQLGHTLNSTRSTQRTQNVHSKLQMRASDESGGRALLQCSQVGRSSSIDSLWTVYVRDRRVPRRIDGRACPGRLRNSGARRAGETGRHTGPQPPIRRRGCHSGCLPR